MKHLLLAALAGAAALLGLGMVCATNAPLVPEFVQVPDAVYARAEAEFRVATTAPGDRDVVYVLDWGDGAVDTTNGWQSGDAVALRHTWQDAGGYAVKALAFVQEEPDLASEWSEPLAVTVQANGVPVAHGLEGPAHALRGVWAQFRARAADSDDDSVAVQFDFNGTIGAWTAFGDTGAWFEDSFKFSTVETATVRVRARDTKGSVSGWSDSVLVPVDTVGRLLWFWMGEGEEPEAPLGQLLMVLDGSVEVALFLATDGKYRSVDVGTGRVKGTFPPGPSGDAFNGLPAYCAATGHIIVGSEFGALYALTTSLQVAWRWTGDDTMSGIVWGVPAICGDTIYVPRDNDTLYCFKDLGDTVELVEARRVSSVSVDVAPLVQSNGNVYCMDYSGRLYCWLPGLDSLVWLDTISSDNRWCIAAGEDGLVYCAGEDDRVHAVGPDGEVAWSIRVDFESYALVVGDGAVFPATGDGALVALDAATGATRWSHEYTEGELYVSPLLTANGLIYCQDNDDVLYCIDRSDGSLVWSCDCPSFTGVARGRGGLDIPIASPATTSNGDIILVGRDALYCVKGYRNGPLDPQAVWPKWQRDAYNSGSVGD